MQTRKLGNTNLHLTEIGLGVWAIRGSGDGLQLGATERARLRRSRIYGQEMPARSLRCPRYARLY